MSQYKVIERIERPDPALVERYRHLNLAIVAPAVGQAQIMDPALKPLDPAWTICGPAVTVRLDYTDILICGAATEVARPGDVICVAAQGRMEAAVWGGGLTRASLVAGATGVVVDGVVESTAAIVNEIGLPVWARGVFPRAGTVEKPGSVNVPVTIGGVTVNPGDLILGNRDCLYAIPRERLEDLIDGLERGSASLAEVSRRWRSGERWADFFQNRGGREKLASLGVEWIAE